MDNLLKKGDVLLLPIKEIRQENKKSFFIVSHEGREHAILMFDFQKNDPRTEKLQCVVKEIREDQHIIETAFIFETLSLRWAYNPESYTAFPTSAR